MNAIKELKAWMDETGTRQRDLVLWTGYSKGHISEVLAGKTKGRIGLPLAVSIEQITKKRIKVAHWAAGFGK